MRPLIDFINAITLYINVLIFEAAKIMQKINLAKEKRGIMTVNQRKESSKKKEKTNDSKQKEE